MTWIGWLGLYLGIGFLFALVICGAMVCLGFLESKDISGKLHHGLHIVMLWPIYLLVVAYYFATDAFIETFWEGGRP